MENRDYIQTIANCITECLPSRLFTDSECPPLVLHKASVQNIIKEKDSGLKNKNNLRYILGVLEMWALELLDSDEGPLPPKIPDLNTLQKIEVLSDSILKDSIIIQIFSPENNEELNYMVTCDPLEGPQIYNIDSVNTPLAKGVKEIEKFLKQELNRPAVEDLKKFTDLELVFIANCLENNNPPEELNKLQYIIDEALVSRGLFPGSSKRSKLERLI